MQCIVKEKSLLSPVNRRSNRHKSVNRSFRNVRKVAHSFFGSITILWTALVQKTPLIGARLYSIIPSALSIVEKDSLELFISILTKMLALHK